MAEPRLGVALVGFAHSHGEKWAESLRDDPRVDLVGTWDDDLERGRRTTARLAIPFEPDLDILFDDPRVGAVAITSEHARHVEHIERAAAKGKHVLCEKPVAIDADGFARVSTAVRAAGIRFMQAFHMRLDPAHQEARRLLRSGAIGTIGSARLRHSHDFGLVGWPHGIDEWIFDPKRSGGGVGLDEMIHTCDWLRWVFGEPTSVIAERGNHVLGRDVEDTIAATFRLPNGALAVLESSWTAVGGAVTHEFCGVDGTLLQIRSDIAATRSPDLLGSSILLVAAGGAQWERPEARSVMTDKPHHRIPREFVRCLLADEAFPASLEDGIRAARMVLAAYESADTGRRVDLTEPR